MADEGSQREGVSDEVAKGVACVGAGAVGFIDVVGDGAGGVGLPGDLFEILCQLAAAGVNEEAGFVRVAAEAAVDAIDAVAHGRVRSGCIKEALEVTFVLGEELADDNPISSGGGGALLMAAGIAIDADAREANACSPRL